ncbi:GAF and ANTAR domain-containing protein [Pseudarthrobacter sp. RMG13]|uniref:GAF and ANTAR domain-containing protein n=1 Tax=Pseudarthrobacter humi TaxID=2952523 RepID=A0ABT1LMI9_9MICC|nr:GAF and ANTAR domain-containing protein [Pseudarthrobacter humi]MCP8999655.1 GAF and ANTAR domain-containing protein [Pseudarthrobacter humi]
MDIAPDMAAGEEDVCAPYLAKLPITGAAVTLFGGATAETLVSASDELAARLDELQFNLGEGPRWRAHKTRLPVLVPDAQSTAGDEWPMFHQAIAGTDAAALFVFPLTVGAVDLGVVELYHSVRGNLSRSDRSMAAVLAGQTSWYLLRKILTLRSPDTDPALEPALMSRREIHQATGMVLAQSGATASESLLMLRAYAFANDLTLKETAAAVLEGRLSFDTGNGGPGGPVLQ